ncbi:Thoeris anti-defense Tad2 family protein [Pseudoalteromonas rubra]|uniref:Thoeris anti-defense Tad2 family protein n=1 Tax=Pseudoalteromonas rubra TaxID=43658 RepID=UPI002DB930B8|nr:hypothetical protein [Pseudoalteromonas rubra]MEC4091605.1 hypothetical protein [Pseudoalteromonas rubra]
MHTNKQYLFKSVAKVRVMKALGINATSDSLEVVVEGQRRPVLVELTRALKNDIALSRLDPGKLRFLVQIKQLDGASVHRILCKKQLDSQLTPVDKIADLECAAGTFSWALEQMRQLHLCVTREAWIPDCKCDANRTYVYFKDRQHKVKADRPIRGLFKNDQVSTKSTFQICDGYGVVDTWTPTAEDLIATDWMLAEVQHG